MQKGGLFGFFENSDPNAPKKSWGEWFSGTTSGASNMLSSATNSITGAASNFGSNISKSLNSDVDLTGTQQPIQQPTQQPITQYSTQQPIQQYPKQQYPKQQYPIQQPIGGKRAKRSKTMRMKGGKGGLGLSYYASPVSDLKVATPTYWEVYSNGTNQYTIKGGNRTKKHGHKGRKSKNSRRNKK